MTSVGVSLIQVLSWYNLSAVASPPTPPTNLHLTVPGAVSVTAQPQSQAVVAGQNATFTVAASGTAPLSYQWTFNGLIVGSNSYSYTRTNCRLDDDGGHVRVTVGNAIGSIQSGSVILSVNPNVPNYFVSVTGSSTNTGVSTNSSWSLSYALTRVGPSNILTLMPGTYPSVTLGTSGLTLRSQTKWAAKILGSPATHGIVTTTGVSNVVVDGFEIAYSYIDGVKINGPNNTVRNCWIHHAGQGDPNWAVNTNMSFSGQGVAAHDEYGTLVENNLIENCGAWIRHDHGVYLNGTNCVIRNNVIRDNLAYGIQLYDYPNECSNIQVYNNLIYGNDAGLTIWADSPYTNYVYNNTILVPSNYCVISVYGRLVVNNNILMVNAGWWPTVAPENGSVVSTDYNLVNKAPQSPYPGGAHDVVASDPGFVSKTTGLFWLASASPARNAANPAVVLPVDFFGRTGLGLLDVGAFQFAPALAADLRVLDPLAPGSDYWSLP